MFKKCLLTSAMALLAFGASMAQAHYTAVIPNHSMVLDKKEANFEVLVGFTHPMQQHGMNMAKPQQAFVYVNGEKTDVLPKLKPAKLFGKQAWTFDYKVTRPGIYQIGVESTPYWEGAEDQWLQQYSKVLIPAYGEEMGWEKPIGMKGEIIPFMRPWGNYVGNTFTGQIVYDGKPIPHALIAVQYLNKDGKYKAPNAYYTPQMLIADERGVFSYSVPYEGWWVFGAFFEGPEKVDHEGVKKPVEVAAMVWAKFVDPIVVKK